MTEAATAPTAPIAATAPTAGAPRRGWGRRRARRAAGYAVVVALGLVLVVLLALSAQRPGQPLDPDDPGRSGAMALAQVLREKGVDVEVVRSIDALEASGPDRATTVLVADPTNLGPGAAERLGAATRSTGRLVLAGVDSEQLETLGMPVEAFVGGGDELVARCSSTVALDSDVVFAWDVRYLVADGATGASTCFALPAPDSTTGEPASDGAYGAALVELAATSTTPQTLVVGFGPAWMNMQITDGSHAGTAVRALGSTPRLVWYQPGTSDLTVPGLDGEPGEGASVWPVWTVPAIVLLGVAVVVLALARGRRLGRLVSEPLPVVVRAIETTESRGRLYRRAGDPARAAAVLRGGTIERLARRLAVPRSAGIAAVVHAVSLASGRPGVEVADILEGPPPPDDAALIHLAQQLTDLEERVRHP